MPASAHDIAAAFRERQPKLGARKLQALLYYAQGHHLAFFGRPLFGDAICAWDSGPGVDALWDEEAGGALGEPGGLGEAELNTVGYVLSRYGKLSTQELEDRVQAEAPWQRADAGRVPGGSALVEVKWIREFFAAQAAEEDDLGLDPAEVKRMLQAAARRRDEPRRTDSLEDIRAWLAARA
ncbi:MULTISPECIES: type II toxin-antitoxin system antitoxin SocA domain-containing protein [unclassified Nonomuraea]|uniref:Panacea domain-containing protein n=1 Tax=unclassified Nonomuraea TaxID=2593643 RepID=UPI0033D6828D